jgi:hypothetical protein
VESSPKRRSQVATSKRTFHMRGILQLCLILPSIDQYPKASEVEEQSTLEYIPPSLHLLLQNLLVGKNIRKKEASIGQSIIQGAQPRALLAPHHTI